jgi:CheY-like chemotaxis protein
MKNILLINNDYREAEAIRNILGRMIANASLFTVGNGNDALHIIMGGSLYFKGRPDVILLSRNLPDMTACEFLEIMRKYYSLEHIKVFLLSAKVTDRDLNLFKNLGIAGYLQGPFENSPATIAKFKFLKSVLNGSEASTAIFAAMKTKFKSGLSVLKKSVLKSKVLSLHLGSVTGIKITSCVAAALIISSATIYTISSHAAESPVNTKMVIAPVQAELFIKKKAATEPETQPAPHPTKKPPSKIKDVQTKLSGHTDSIEKKKTHSFTEKVFSIGVVKDNAMH